jgi:hypothetical protein
MVLKHRRMLAQGFLTGTSDTDDWCHPVPGKCLRRLHSNRDDRRRQNRNPRHHSMNASGAAENDSLKLMKPRKSRIDSRLSIEGFGHDVRHLKDLCTEPAQLSGDGRTFRPRAGDQQSSSSQWSALEPCDALTDAHDISDNDKHRCGRINVRYLGRKRGERPHDDLLIRSGGGGDIGSWRFRGGRPESGAADLRQVFDRP